MRFSSPDDTSVPAPIVGRHIPALDGVRGLAVLAVVIYHGMVTEQGTTIDRLVFSIRQPLWAGVDLFFVLSGFLITGILLDTRSTPNYFRNFFARRVLRIFPLYYGVLVGLFVVLPLAGLAIPQVRAVVHGDYFSRLWDHQLWLWTYTQNFLLPEGGQYGLPGLGHFWTLAIEEQFYLIWPFVVFFVRGRSLLWASLTICIAVCIFRPAALTYGLMDEWSVRHFTFTRIDTLLYGAIAAIVVRDAQLLSWGMRYWRVCVVLLSIVVSACWISAGELGSENSLVEIFVFPAFGILFAIGILLAVVAESDAAPIRLLNRSWLRTLGKYSYSIYVFHWPIVWAIHEVVSRFSLYPRLLPFQAMESLAATVLAFVVTIPLSMLSWYVYEQPWLRLKRHFSYGKTKQTSKPKTALPESSSTPPVVATTSGD